MAVNRAPTAPFAGYTYASSTLSFPLSVLPGLTAAHANASTGDWPSIALAILERLNRHYQGLATADKPTGIEVTKAPLSIPTSGSTAGKEGAEYRIRVYYDAPDLAGVMAEPV